MISDIIFKLKSLFSYCVTICKFKSNRIFFGSFHTNGVPYVRILKGGSVIIGSHLIMNNGMAGNQIGYGKTPCTLISIGDYTMIGSGVKIYTSDFHPLDAKSRRVPKLNVTERKSADVVIGKDCFIGAGSIILKGVTIGNNSVVGAGSVVSKSIPDNSIAVGNSCKVVKTNI